MTRQKRRKMGMALRQTGEMAANGVAEALALQMACADQKVTAPEAGVADLLPEKWQQARRFMRDDSGATDLPAIVAMADLLDPPESQSVSFWMMLALLGIAGFTLSLFGIFVAPAFKDLFKSFGADLPALTQFMLSLSEWVLAPLGLVSLVLFVFIVIGTKFAGRYYYRLEQWGMRVPLIGHAMQVQNTKRLSRWLAGTAHRQDTSAGLRAALELVEPGVYQRALATLEARIAKGEAIDRAVSAVGWLPGLGMLLKATPDDVVGLRAYALSLDSRADVVMARLNLVTQIVTGAVVGILVISMYLPIFKMGSAI